MKQTEIVKEKLEGCGKKFSGGNKKYRKSYSYFCGSVGIMGNISFCPTCKATLSGMQIAIQNELEFLEDIINWMDENGIQNILYRDIEIRITDCKNALKLIRERE